MATTAGALLFAVLAVVVPLRGRARFTRFRNTPWVDPGARKRLFLSSLPLKYTVALAATALFVAEARAGHGVPVVPSDLAHLAVALPLLGAIALGAVRTRALLYSDDGRAQVTNALQRVAEVVPRTRAERRVWIVAAVSTGVTEEVTYRAFAMSFLAGVFGNQNVIAIGVVSSAVFGLAHLYQGWRGVVFTTLLGAALAVVAVASGLLAAIIVHTIIDLRLLVVPVDVAEAVDAGTGDRSQIRCGGWPPRCPYCPSPTGPCLEWSPRH
jgi:CAAX protease family protein